MKWFTNLSDRVKSVAVLLTSIVSIVGILGSFGASILGDYLDKSYATIQALDDKSQEAQDSLKALAEGQAKIQYQSSIIAYKYLSVELRKYNISEVKNGSEEGKYYYKEMHKQHFLAGQRIGKIGPSIEYSSPF
jgi:hypothetical protein